MFETFYRNFYKEEIGELVQNYPDDQRSLHIDWEDLYKFDPDLADDYLAQPDQLREYAEEALRIYDLPVDISLGRAHVRVFNLPESTDVGSIRSRHIGQLVAVTGTVDSVEQSSTRLVEAAYECQRCGTLTYVPQSGRDEKEPHECQGCEREGPFEVNTEQSEYVDSQTIFVEQSQVGLGTDADRESILVDLEDDIVDEVRPGATISVTGIVRKDDDIADSRASIPDKYIEAVAVKDASRYQVEITQAEKAEIVELSMSPDIYEKMIGSLAPSVYGFEDEKLALILQLFSGVTKRLPDDTRIRGDIHIGLIGDPGTAKSRLVRYAAQLAPKSILTSGTSTSAVGLTAAAKRTSRNDKTWTFEAGALPKADHGLAGIDNLTDFGTEEIRSLHDALEDQTINLSKGSATVSMKARASVLAAGNPKYGRFDQYEPIGEQIDLDPGLLSQFDLLFTIIDQPDESSDEELADHILQANYAGELNTQQSEMATPDVTEEQVREAADEVSPAIKPDLLRKYIAHARENIYPTLTEGAREAIREYYVSVRSRGSDDDAPVPVSARKLEAIVRLAEASARVRLSDTVEKEDAVRVIELIRSSLRDIGVDPETGQFDADIVEADEERQDRIENIKQLIHDIEQDYEDGAPVDVVFDRVEEIGMDPTKAEREIEKLKQKGEVYEPNLDHLRTG